MERMWCRTCCYVSLNVDNFKNLNKVLPILQLIVPEIRLTLPADVIICCQCYYFLKNAENFRRKCLDTKMKWIDYNVSVLVGANTYSDHRVQNLIPHLSRSESRIPYAILPTRHRKVSGFEPPSTPSMSQDIRYSEPWNLTCQISNNDSRNDRAIKSISESYNKSYSVLRNVDHEVPDDTPINYMHTEFKFTAEDVIIQPAVDTSICQGPHDSEPSNIKSQPSNINYQIPNTSYSQPEICETIEMVEINDRKIELKISTGKRILDEEEDDIFIEENTDHAVIKKERYEENPSFFNIKSSDGLYRCKLCDKKYKNSKGLYDHTQNKHRELKFFHCCQCNFFSLWKSTLERHVTLFHTKQPLKEKKRCSETAKYVVPVLNCYHCSFVTNSKKDMEDHLGRVHPKI